MSILLTQDMRDYTTFKIGGKADIAFPANLEEFSEYITTQFAMNSPPIILGNGSNVLVRDCGVTPLIISTKRLTDVQIDSERNTVYAQTGVMCDDLIDKTVAHNMCGMEGLTGIPGTVGGMIYMNASYTSPISDIVRKVYAIDKYGEEHVLRPPDCEFGYRTSIFHKRELFITGVIFQLRRGNLSDVVKKYRSNRKRMQPVEFPSAGSVFKKVSLESVKGLRVGDAEVSTKCSSFIINRGNATAQDVLDLITLIEERLGQKLNLEIEII